MATSPKGFRMAPLQRLKVIPITDPAEQAALDERLKRIEDAATNDATPAPGRAGTIAEAPSIRSRTSKRKRRQ